MAQVSPSNFRVMHSILMSSIAVYNVQQIHIFDTHTQTHTHFVRFVVCVTLRNCWKENFSMQRIKFWNRFGRKVKKLIFTVIYHFRQTDWLTDCQWASCLFITLPILFSPFVTLIALNNKSDILTVGHVLFYLQFVFYFSIFFSFILFSFSLHLLSFFCSHFVWIKCLTVIQFIEMNVTDDKRQSKLQTEIKKY